VTTDAELRNLLADALALWGVAARVAAGPQGLLVTRGAAVFTVARGAAPARWMLQTPARAAAGRRPRAVPSVVALLTALRAALDVPPGARLRIGAGAGMAGAGMAGAGMAGSAP